MSSSTRPSGAGYEDFDDVTADLFQSGPHLSASGPTHLSLHYAQGIRNVPTKLRIQVSRKRNDDEDAKVSIHCGGNELRHCLLLVYSVC